MSKVIDTGGSENLEESRRNEKPEAMKVTISIRIWKIRVKLEISL